MRIALICHEEEILNREGLARWLASFAELAGMVVLREPPDRKRRRLRREIRRVGWLRIVDVLAFRLYYRLFLAAGDRRWESALLADLERRFPPLPATTRRFIAPTANAPEAEAFLRACAPDLVIARCKHLLKESVFSIPARGTFVMHPGVCPEYRNAHGCFWALAERDLEKVGMTLLRIDKGIDTGPVYGYFFYRGDERAESHVVVQHRVVFDHLDALRAKLEEIGRGEARPLDTRGRPSGEWGQPWLTRYWRWKREANRRAA